MAYPNPFRTRHSEAASRNIALFTATFAPEVLHALPAPPFEQFYVIRSAPGAGKTSLMKCLTASTLRYVHQHRSKTATLVSFLTDFGVLEPTGPLVIGVLENLDQNYAGLLDVTQDPDRRRRLLFKLIDARVIQGLVRSSLEFLGKSPSDDPDLVKFHPTTPDSTRAFSRLGGTSGAELIRAAEAAEDELLDLFDEIIATPGEMPAGHSRMHSLTALSATEIEVAGVRLPARPLIMFDDAHALAEDQRNALLGELRNRAITVGRWLATRNVALEDDELFGAGDEGRDFDVIELEALARERTSSAVALKRLAGQTLTPARFRNVLLDIADKRASGALDRMLTDDTALTSLIRVEPDDALLNASENPFDKVRARIAAIGGADPRYSEWMRETEQLEGRDGLARLSELEVLIERDRSRAQQELFAGLPLAHEELTARGSSSLREAAYLRTAVDCGIPYYLGTESYARLGGANIEQFLELCGDLMARLQTQDATGRELALTPAIQDKIARDASRAYYRGLLHLPDGDYVQRLVDGVARISREEARKPRIPYPPGVTGTALRMSDRAKLREPETQKMPQMEMLYRALKSAIAHNVVWIELNYRVKNRDYMVIYLNRLLCPVFDMPLGLGGFRERKLIDMSSWMVETPPRTAEGADEGQGKLL